MNYLDHKTLDSEFFQTKLKDYEFVEDVNDVNVGDHLRYCKNQYQKEGRTCHYCVVKSIDPLMVNAYKNQVYDDWKLDIDNYYKKITLYKKGVKPHTGKCETCSKFVKAPYYTCWDCLIERKEKEKKELNENRYVKEKYGQNNFDK
jgi:hypothetical protein